MKQKRPPIVTVLGHVDHGKTTLLDAIRTLASSGKKSRVAESELGGITQGIGASQVETKEGKITFLDTPGHAAFSQMRKRGVKVADIAILVVAADDGIMPQTKEALSYIKDTKISTIVAFTKIDLPSANVERALGQLEQEEIFFEGRGGQTPYVQVSAKEGKGISELLEIINLFSDVIEITGDDEAPLLAAVIETNKDKRGILVSAVIKNGTLRVGDKVTAKIPGGNAYSARVKGLFGEDGKPVKEAYLGDPVAILGFSEAPEVGAEISTGDGESAVIRDTQAGYKNTKVGEDQVAVIIKTQKKGSIEAIEASLPVGVVVLGSSIGDVTESDIFFAKTTKSIIVSFEAGIPGSVKRLADTEGVEITDFGIIYELLEFLQKRVLLGKAEVLGKAEILAEFPFNKTRVAGCKVVEGKLQKKDVVLLMRNDKEIGSATVTSMRRGKNDLLEAKVGEECGVILSPPVNFEKGDILVAKKPGASKK